MNNLANKDKDKSIRNELVARSSIRKMVDNIRSSSKHSSELIYGTSDSIHDENSGDIKDIKNIINKVNLQYKQTTGDNIIDFFNAVNNNAPAKRGKKKNNMNGFLDITKQLEKPEMYNINELFSVENDRAILYDNYKLICDNIPQLSQALSTYVDNILSPDDFTKTVFNISIDGKITSAGSTSASDNSIVENIKSLMKTYKIENLSKEILKESLKLGDQFVCVLPVKQEIGKMLTESINRNDLFVSTESKLEFSPKEIIFENEELVEWVNSTIDNIKDKINIPTPINESVATKEEKFKYKTEKILFETKKQQFQAEIAECLNNTFKFYESPDILAEDLYLMNEDFQKEISNNLIDIPFKSKSKAMREKKKDKTPITVNGSIIKVLDPGRTVKLDMDGICFGYYYMERTEGKGEEAARGNYSATNSIFTSFSNTMAPELPNSKYRLITDIFVKNISKKLNKKFINNNPSFKNTIYTMLRQQYMTENQIKVIYIPPNQVVHFGEGGVANNEYHDSIFKPILYTAKIYLAVQTSMLMLKLVRSPEKRAFYIETDLDQDAEAVVQAFVRDSKTKEIKMESFNKDINTVLNSIGCFNDYFIPVVDGNKPVEIDTLQGMNVEMSNDFLEYLLNTLISGMGLPKEFLSYADQTEFARSLAIK